MTDRALGTRSGDPVAQPPQPQGRPSAAAAARDKEPAYYPGNIPPVYNVPVIVGWNGRVLEAAYVVHPKTKRPCWIEWRDGEAFALPPKRGGRNWGEHPEWWRPLRPDQYRWRLPAPITRLVRQAAPGATVDEDDAPATDAGGGVWWLDHSLITYSPAGKVSSRECEGRLLRAVSTAGAGRGLGLRTRTTGTILAEILDAIDGLAGDAGDLREIIPRFESLPADESDFLTAMGWFAALNPPQAYHKRREAWSLALRQRILVWRSGTRPYPFAQIAQWQNRSPSRMRELYADAIDKAHAAANGRRVFAEFPSADPMAEVRAANRAWRSISGETP